MKITRLELPLGERTLVLETGKLAKQAHGAVVAAEVGNQVERVDRWVVVDLADLADLVDPADPADPAAIVNLERRALLSRSLM